MPTFPFNKETTGNTSVTQGVAKQFLIPVLDADGSVIDLTTSGAAGAASTLSFLIFPIDKVDVTDVALTVTPTASSLGAKVVLSAEQTLTLRKGTHKYVLEVGDDAAVAHPAQRGSIVVDIA